MEPHHAPLKCEADAAKRICASTAVSRRYGAVTALHAVDLAVAEGELLTLLGPSGCGKTTVLRLVAGFVEPAGGRILIDERRRHPPAAEPPLHRHGVPELRAVPAS